MLRLTYFILPVSLLCWYRGYLLYREVQNEVYRSASGSQIIPKLNKFSTDKSLEWNKDNVFHFVHISDLHISQFSNKSTENLEYFINTTLPKINPKFVIVTGDITDAKDERKVSSLQLLEEWQTYQGLLKKYNLNNTFWYDIPGNHDFFNVPSWNSSRNYFRTMSSTKKDNYHFVYQPKNTNSKYLFIGINACPTRGTARPFNFFAYMDTEDMDLIYNAVVSEDYNHVFLFTHYPMATTLAGTTSNGFTFEQLSHKITIILNGHLHTLIAGLGDIMHARFDQSSHSLLELELGDMKSHGIFRVISIDNDLISFIDRSIIPKVDLKMQNLPVQKLEVQSRFQNNPIVLITNPKDAKYLIHGHEKSFNQLLSNSIRFYVFGYEVGNNVQVVIDGQELSSEVEIIGPSFYSVKWNPNLYNDKKLHTLKVQVGIDNDISYHEVKFSFDEDYKPPLSIGFGEYVMNSNLSYWGPIVFILSYIFAYVFLLIIPKILSAYLHKTKKYFKWRINYSKYLINIDKPKPFSLGNQKSIVSWYWLQAYYFTLSVLIDFKYFVHATIYRLVTLASIPNTFYPLLVYLLYIMAGPYFVGELVPSALDDPNSTYQDSLGWFYVYGFWLENKWVPITDTYMYALFEIVYLFCPLVIYLSFCITPPEQLYSKPPTKEQIIDAGSEVFWIPPIHNRRQYPLHRRLFVRLFVVLNVLYQLNNVFFMSLWYGPLAMILSPGKTWFVLWGCYALYNHRWSFKGREVDLIEPEQDNLVKKFSGKLKNLSESLKRSSSSLTNLIPSIEKVDSQLSTEQNSYNRRLRKQENSKS